MPNGKRHLTQVRPRNGDGPPYAPQRDLAWIYAPAMKEALVALDQVNWSDEIEAICDELALTEDEIGEAVAKLTEAHLYFVNNPDVQTPNDALEKVGWYDTHPGARYLIYGRMGEVMLGGFFLALRDVSEHASESAQAEEICQLVAAGKQIMERGSGKVCQDPTEFSKLEAKLHELEARCRSMSDSMKQAKERMLNAEDTARAKDSTMLDLAQEKNKLERDKERLISQAETLEETTNTMGRITNRLRNMTLWQGLWWAFAGVDTRDRWMNQQSTLEKKSSS